MSKTSVVEKTTESGEGTDDGNGGTGTWRVENVRENMAQEGILREGF